jgi:ClpP class serine protease
VSRTKEQVEAVAADIAASGGRAIALPADITELGLLAG